MSQASADIATPEVKPARSLRIRWYLIALLVIGGIINYLDRNNLSIANTTIAKEFGLNTFQMGLLLSAFSWPYAIANLPAGYLVDKFGPKRMFAWAAGLWSIISMLSAFANSFGVLYAARVALGIAESPFFTSGLKVADKWFNKSERALPVSIINTGSQLANAIAPPLLTFLMLTMSWRGMFIVIGAMGIVIALVWLRIYRDPTMKEQFIIKSHEFEEQQQPKEKQAGWGELLKKKNTWFMVLAPSVSSTRSGFTSPGFRATSRRPAASASARSAGLPAFRSSAASLVSSPVASSPAN